MTDTSGQPPESVPSIPQAISSLAPQTDGNGDETWFGETIDAFKRASDTVTGVSKLVGQAIQGAMGTVGGAISQGQAASNQAQAGIDQQAQAQTTKARLEGAANDKLVNDNITVATAEGTTPQQMVERANRMSMLAKNVQADNDELTARAGVSIWNDPLTFIGNLFTNPFVEAKHDADVQALKEEHALIQMQQAQTSDAYRVNAGVDAVHGADYTKSITDDIAGKALQAKAAATLEQAKFSTSSAGVLVSLNEADMNNAVKLQSTAANALNEARENLGFDLTAGSKSARSQRIAQQAADLKAADTSHLIASQVMGRSVPVTDTELRQMPNNQKAAFADLSNAALNAVGAGHVAGVELSPAELPLGGTPYDAAFNKTTLGIKMATPSQEDTVRFIQNVAASEMNKSTKPGQTPFRQLPNDVKKSVVNGAIEQQYGQLYKAIPATGSILSPGSLSSLLKNPVLAGTRLGQALAPLALDPTAPVNYDAINYQANKLIDAGTPIPQVAAEMKLFGQQMTAQVNAIRGLSRVALPALGSSDHPNFNVNMSDGAGNIATFDLNNQADIENKLTRQKIQRNVANTGLRFLPITGSP